jgi:hypothetical protein
VANVIVVLTLIVASASAQTDPKTAMLERAGWDALARNQPREAANAFREAIARDPGMRISISAQEQRVPRAP